MGLRFNAPPGWPPPPAGWMPSPDWQPDPSWPPAPEGWQFWITDDPQSPPQISPASSPPSVQPETRQPPTKGMPVGHSGPAASQPPTVNKASRRSGGLFGGKKRTQELEAENEELRGLVVQLNGMDLLELARETERVRSQLAEVYQEIARANGEVAAAQQELERVQGGIVVTEETALLQEVGVYEYQHPLADAVAYKSVLAQLKDTIKTMTKGGNAVMGATSWQVNGSSRGTITTPCECMSLSSRPTT